MPRIGLIAGLRLALAALLEICCTLILVAHFLLLATRAACINWLVFTRNLFMRGVARFGLFPPIALSRTVGRWGGQRNVSMLKGWLWILFLWMVIVTIFIVG